MNPDALEKGRQNGGNPQPKSSFLLPRFLLGGTIGQPDTGSASGGTYTLDGGIWVKGILEFLEHLIHLPLVLK